MGLHHLSDWLNRQLKKIIRFSGTEEITSYVLSIENPDDQVQYLATMLDLSSSVHVAFIEEYRLKTRSTKQLHQPEETRQYRKKDQDLEYVSASTNKQLKKPNGQNVTSNISRSNHIFTEAGNLSEKPVSSSKPQEKQRSKCNCQATKHALINNCLSCGKVVCQKEGSGPCLFCGELVCTKEEKEILNRGSKKSVELGEKLMGGYKNLSSKAVSGVQIAVMNKNKLLEYDRNSERRTKVIDDESDYFSIDSYKWMTPEQKTKLKAREEELRQKRYGSRLDRKLDFDFAGRRIVETESMLSKMNLEEDEVIKSIYQKNGSSAFVSATSIIRSDGGNIKNDCVADINIDIPRPRLVESKILRDGKYSKDTKLLKVTKLSERLNRSIVRVQDKNLQEMTDTGMCISIHQPYASYIVAGIKIHEGRTWYSSHRGRLWIHAAC